LSKKTFAVHARKINFRLKSNLSKNLCETVARFFHHTSAI